MHQGKQVAANGPGSGNPASSPKSATTALPAVLPPAHLPPGCPAGRRPSQRQTRRRCPSAAPPPPSAGPRCLHAGRQQRASVRVLISDGPGWPAGQAFQLRPSHPHTGPGAATSTPVHSHFDTTTRATTTPSPSAMYASRSAPQPVLRCIHSAQCGKPRAPPRGSSESSEARATSLRARRRGSWHTASASGGASSTVPKRSAWWRAGHGGVGSVKSRWAKPGGRLCNGWCVQAVGCRPAPHPAPGSRR